MPGFGEHESRHLIKTTPTEHCHVLSFDRPLSDEMPLRFENPRQQTPKNSKNEKFGFCTFQNAREHLLTLSELGERVSGSCGKKKVLFLPQMGAGMDSVFKDSAIAQTGSVSY